MAPHPSVGPLDLLLVYIAPSSHGVGQRLTVQTIESRLKALPLRPVLRLLAIVAHRADQSVRDPSERVAVAKALLRPGRARMRALALIEAGPNALVSSQTALLLAQRALVHCPDVRKPLEDEELGYRLGELLVALADHLNRGHPNDDDMLLELVRLALFYRLSGAGEWYSTAHAVFFETLPSMTSDHEYVDVDALLRSELGISLEHYWAVSATVGVVALSDKQVHVYPKQVGALPTEVLTRWFSAQTQTIDEARALAVRDLEAGSSWALDTFFLRPIIDGVVPGGGYPMRSQLLALKGTLIGMHYLVSDLLRQRGGDAHLAWSRFFGRAVEAHGRYLLKTLLEDPAIVSFPDAERPAGPNIRPACDFYVEDGGAVVAGDFVHRSLTLPTQTTGTPAALEKDLRRAIVEKVDQIDATLSAKNPGTHRIHPVVVMSGPLPMNPLLASKLEDLLRQRPLQFVARDPRCRPVAVLELHEFRMLLLTATANRQTVSEVLLSWQASPLGANSFRDWLATQTELVPGRARPGEKWEERVHSIFGVEAVSRADDGEAPAAR